MTDEQIIEALATQVMGWQLHPTYNSLHGWYVPDGDQFRFEARADWNPLSKIQDAWMVVEKMTAWDKDEVPLFWFSLDYRDNELWDVGFCRTGGLGEDLDEWAWVTVHPIADVPRGICKAALKAHGIEAVSNEDPMRESNP